MRFDMPDVKANLRHIVCDFARLRQILTFTPFSLQVLAPDLFLPMVAAPPESTTQLSVGQPCRGGYLTRAWLRLQMSDFIQVVLRAAKRGNGTCPADLP